MRHANTTYDTKVDALLNPPLTEEGVQRTGRTVEFLDREGAKPARIISSPLQRALRVADLISRGNIKVSVNNSALPWNLGDLMGREGKEAAPYIDYLKNYPDIKAPHGEAYRTFYDRWDRLLQLVMSYAEIKDQDLMIVTHSRNINALQSIIGGKAVGDVEELAPEASVTLLAKNGVGDWDFSIIWDGK